jgi:predicted TIM-barrel fold metal-dependent hydrolase
VIESAYRQLGPERILFGTEYPLQHPRVEIEKALCLELDTPSFEAMMGGNFLRLIDGKGGWQ